MLPHAQLHVRQSPETASVVSSSTGSWTSTADSSGNESTSTMSVAPKTGAPGGKDIYSKKAKDSPQTTSQEKHGQALEEEVKTEDLTSLTATPATFLLLQSDGVDIQRHLNTSEPSKLLTTTQPDSKRIRGRQPPLTSEDKENLGVKNTLPSKKHLPNRPRTVSSPPTLKRSRSTPRQTHMLPIPSIPSKVLGTSQSYRQTNTEYVGDGFDFSVIEPQPTDKSSDVNAPPPNILAQASHTLKPTQEKPPQKGHFASFPHLPLQTYLHLALSSPEITGISQKATTPGHASDMKYPYIPSDSPDLILERITNFFFLPPFLEKVLLFGMLACLDSWLYTFTILPLRFARALGLLVSYWFCTIASFWKGGKRLQKRKTVETDTRASDPPEAASTEKAKAKRGELRERERSVSSLRPQHKADLLKGAVVIITCFVLTRLDASRMYHSIRGQAAIKLYVIYNVLEVGDRLLSALGQDIFECLCSKGTLERKPDGRSKVLRPFWCFILAATYNIIHATCLFYQMVTLNVAVNSYSNALLTLLLSNQFVEIKSTVFKRFEKENLFQITCADIVERFQLWVMLSIIISRNLVELGVRSSSEIFNTPIGEEMLNGTATPSSSGGVVTPRSFTIFPSWAGQVFGPFLMVMGSETLVDWLKHAYITKFNQIRPRIYERFLDVLCRDYYSYVKAFADQNITRRFGLPVIPLACLFIRASMQTYRMFIATHNPTPLPILAPATKLQDSHMVTAPSSPAAAAALRKFDLLLRRALGSSSIPPEVTPSSSPPFSSYFGTQFADDIIAATTVSVFFLGVFLLFLAVKLVLGMAMVAYARGRYKGMKEREREDVLTGGRRVGGFGLVEVDESKRKAIYAGDKEGGDRVRNWEMKSREREVEGVLGVSGKNGKAPGVNLDEVERYSMVAKRIW